MADNETRVWLKCLKRSPAAWNQMRQQDDFSTISLSRQFLTKANLRGVDFRSCTFIDCSFTGADLINSNLSGAKFRSCRFSDANLTGANLASAALTASDLTRAVLFGADLTKATLFQSSCRSAILKKAILRETILIDTILQGADLRDAQITGACLFNAITSNWILQGVKCEYAYWDESSSVRQDYAPGDFERLHSSRPAILLHIPCTLAAARAVDFPNLVTFVSSEFPEAGFRLDRISFTSQYAIVGLTLEAVGQSKSDDKVINAFKERFLSVAQWHLASHNRYSASDIVPSQRRPKLTSPIGLDFNKPPAVLRSKKVNLTILFLDLKNFSGRGGDTQRIRSLSTLWDFAHQLLRKNGAELTNTWGDAVVAGFVDPNSAIRNACNLMFFLNHHELQARIGIHTGKVCRCYNPVITMYDIVGDVVNQAARVEPLVTPGEVWITSDVMQHKKLRKNDFSFRPVSATYKKGTEKVQAGDTFQGFAVELMTKNG